MTSKAKLVKEKIGKLDLMKINKFKRHHQESEKTTHRLREEIYKNISDKGHVSSICVCMRVSACVYICMGYIPYIRFPNITALESGQFESLCV